MKVRLKKPVDGSPVLTCVLDDGRATWQHLPSAFPMHDLTHFAVETELRFARGFYGMVSEGWDIQHFGKPWPKGPLPEETGIVEHVVGVCWQEFLTGEATDADGFNGKVAASLARSGAGFRAITLEALTRIRERLAALAWEWRSLEPGRVLELDFAVSGER